MRVTAHLSILLVCAVIGPFAGAQEVPISGRVVDEHGHPATGFEVSLVPILSPFDQALLESSGVAVPVAATDQRSGDGGSFRITAPEPGFWRLIAKAPGYAPMEFAFRREPLLEAATVPELELLPARSLRVATERPDGGPAARAWIATWATDDEPERSRAGGWRPHVPPTLSAADGTASITVPRTHAIELQAWQQGIGTSPKTPATGNAPRLRLRAGSARRILVTDSAGRAVAGAILQVGEANWPAARTGANGIGGIHDDPESTQATILLADGRSASIRLAGDEGVGDEPFEFRVPDAISLSGRVVDVETRRPVSGAFVYPLSAVARHVKTDTRGDFRLSVPARDQSRVTAAAPGFISSSTRTDPASLSPTIALQPAVNLPGLVLDASGEPLTGAEIFARPHGDSMQELRSLFASPSRQTTSDGLGEFVVPRLKKDQPYSITARLDGFATAEAIVRDLEAVASAGGVILTLGSGATLTGRVLAPDGRGVAGASLTLERSEASEAMRFARSDPRQPHPFSFEFSTDAEGEFSFADTPTGEFNLEVQAPGFAREVLPVFEVEIGMRALDLGIVNLEAGIELAGRVVDGDGLPLAGAKISLEQREGVMFSGSYGSDLQAHSGADGYFSFSDRRRGEFLDLAVELSGYAKKEVPRVEVSPASLLEIALEAAVALRGQVLDAEGGAIEGASVSVAREGSGGSYAGRVYSRPEAYGRSDELGRFEVLDIKPGTVRVSAEANGWLATQLGGIELTAGQEPEDLEIELRPGATVAGRVLGPDGSPVSEAMIGVEDSANMRFSGATSDGNGNYSLGGVEPGQRMIGARHEGLQAVKELEVKTGDNRLDFYFEAGVEISGSVVSSAGDPVEGAVLYLSAPGVRSFGGRRQTVRSDAAGAFRIENVLPGLLELTAEHPAFGPTTLAEPLEVGSAPISGLQIRLAAGVEVIGSVLGASPEDLVAIELVAVRQQGSFYKEGRVDSDGGYRIANLGPGTWQIWAQSGTGRQTSEHLEIAEGETQVVLDLEFKDGLILAGRVLSQGQPLGGAWVSAGGTDIESSASVQTDHEGRFRLTGLEAGTYSLRVSEFSSGISHSQEVELVRDEELLIELEGAAVAGQVTARRGHAALSNVTVVLEAIAEGDDGAGNGIPRGASTDAGGRFRLTDVSPGRYRIRISKAGYAAQSQVLDVGDETIDDVDFALEEVEGLSLAVLLPSGAPATQVSYAVLDLAAAVIQSGRETATSEGLVRLATVPDGDWTVMIEAPGTAVRVVRTTAPRENVSVRLERAADLIVRVEELVHDVTTVATLRLTGADGLAFKSLSWNSGIVDNWRLGAGRAALDHLPAGRWIVSITTTDGRSWQRSVSLEAGSNDEVVFD